MDINELRPGDRIKIVDAWVPGCNQNSNGLMDEYLGRILTVRNNCGSFIEVFEDSEDFGIGWSWYPNAIERVFKDSIDNLACDFDAASEEDFLNLLQGTEV